MTHKCLSNGTLLQYMDYKKPKTLTRAHLMERETNYPIRFILYSCNSQQNFTFTFCNITYYTKIERVHGSEEGQWLYTVQ
jgi:hypothetical protein